MLRTATREQVRGAGPKALQRTGDAPGYPIGGLPVMYWIPTPLFDLLRRVVN